MDQPFVSVQWLRERLGDETLRIVDTRSSPHGAPASALTGAAQYALGHIPGAVHLDYGEELSDPATPYAARVAPPQRFAQVMGQAGIGDATTIAAYDAGDVPYAARFLWMCRYYGHDAAYVVAGGLPEWIAEGGSISTETPSYRFATFTARPRDALRASREEVLQIARGGSGAQLLETQRDQTYALRDRGIPNARRLSASLLLEDARGGRFAPPEAIDALVNRLGLDRSKRTICSCGSGVGASGAYLALLRAGFTDVAVYDGSWMEWSHDALPTVPKPT